MKLHGVRRLGRKPLALALGAFLTVGTLMVPAFALAAGSSLRIDPASTTTTPNSTFTVRVVVNSDVPVSGASTTVVFESSRMTLTDMAKGADWADATWVGWPADKAAAIAAYNQSGKVAGYPAGGSIATLFVDGSSSLSAGNHDLIVLTFKAGPCGGDATVGLPLGPNDGGVLSGEAPPMYGEPLAVTSTGGTVVNPCAGGSPSPSPSASASPSPSASASPSPSPSASASPAASTLPGATVTPPPTATAPVPTDQPTAEPTTPTGGEGGATITPPPTDTLPADTTSQSGSWRVLLFSLALGLAGLVVLLITQRQTASRRRR